MRKSLCCARKLKSLMIGPVFERPDRALARAFIEPGQRAGISALIFPVFVRSLCQFIEVFRDGLFEFGRHTTTTRTIAGKRSKAQMF